MDIEIHPYRGLGTIEFGMPRGAVRVLLGSPARPFRKTATSETLTDAFDDVGVHVYYDKDDRCEAVELWSPSIPTLDGTAILGKSFGDVREHLEGLDEALEPYDAGVTSLALGLAVYAPAARKDPSSPVESVLVFRRGYYD